MINVAFMASDAVAIPSMEVLLKSDIARLKCVVSNPDKPKGRGGKTSPNSAAMFALENNIALLRPEKSPNADCVDWLLQNGVDAIIVMAYGKILRDEILNFGKYAVLNLHGSLLPKFRGASPIETALALGEKKSGVSLMRIEKKMDTGAVCAMSEIEISQTETGESLRVKIADCAAKLLAQNLTAWANNSLQFTKQDESLASYTRKIFKDDMQLDFSQSAASLDLRIRAFGAGIAQLGQDFIKIKRASVVLENCGLPEGTVCGCSQKGVDIACANGVLRAEVLQAPCAKALAASDFLNGYKKIAKGARFEPFKNTPLLKTI